LGKVILAALRPDQLDRYLDRVELKALTSKTITNPQRLRRELQEIRRAGIAIDDGEFDNEMRCAAMPVHDFSGQVVGAIGISGPVWRLSIQALQNKARHLDEAARRLSEAFGASQASTK
jgi:DNA-binding IclR family transcriptional regulator